ncbi:MAG: DUF6552 family protein [Sulfitobacter sp.]
MTTITDIPTTSRDTAQLAFWIKWIASIFQIVGYGATAFGWTPWNIYLFLIGLIGWFTVGILWRDRAIILIHVIALGAMIIGLIST